MRKLTIVLLQHDTLCGGMYFGNSYSLISISIFHREKSIPNKFKSISDYGRGEKNIYTFSGRRGKSARGIEAKPGAGRL